MERPVWFHSIGGDMDTILATIRTPLQHAGIPETPYEPAATTGPGVLVVAADDNTIAASAEQVVWERTEGGQHRLLVILVGVRGVSDASWRLLHAGASEVLRWEDTVDPATTVRSRLLRWAEIDDIVAALPGEYDLAGMSPVWIRLLRRVVEAARFTNASMLLLGETGTGKEQLARLIHELDAREDKGDLVVVDCTTVVPDLSGSEFFGHERGAFTGAVSPRDGAFALAHDGTLFLDEIGELHPPLQAQLLRVVQEGTYKRVGGNAWRRTDFRLVCATNRDLLAESAGGSFRADLYYRLAGWICQLPPLRDRPSDIVLLARHFMGAYAPDGRSPDLSPDVERFLITRPYPGNVRDLKQLATRIMLRHVGPGPITVGDIPEDERPAVSIVLDSGAPAAFDTAVRQALAHGAHLKEIGRYAEDSAIRIVTQEEDGNLHRTAQRLGVTDRALQLRRAAQRTNVSHHSDRRSS